MTTLCAVTWNLSLYLAFLSVCCVVGAAAVTLVSNRMDREPPAMPNLSTALFAYTATGMGLTICVLFLLAAIGLLNLWALTAAAFIGLAAAAFTMARLGIDWRAVCGFSGTNRASWVWTVPLLVYAAGLLLGALRQPFAWDELSYHLPYARAYVRAGGLILDEYLRYPLHSHNFNLLYSLALMLGDERLAHLMHGGSALLIALGLFGSIRRYLGLVIALLAVWILFSLIGFRHIIPTAHVDLGLALFVALGGLALWHWRETGCQSWLFVAAFATGMAMGTKYIGAVFAPLFGLWVLLSSRSLKATLSFTFVVTLFGIWWYLRSFLISGNPIHPFAGDLFGYFLWDARDIASQREQLSSLAPGFGILAPFRAAVVLVFGERPQLSILSLPFFAAPLLYRGLSPALRALLAISLAFYLFWSWVLGPSRYLISIMPFMALFSAYAIKKGVDTFSAVPQARRLSGWLHDRRRFLFPIAAALLLTVAARETYFQLERIRTWPWTKAEQVNLMTERYPGYDLMRAANESPEIDGGPLYLMGFGNLNYWYEGRVVGDFFGAARYRQVLSPDPATGVLTPDPERMQILAEKLGIRGLLIETAAFRRLDPQDWSRHFRLLKQTEIGTLWSVDTRDSQ